MPDCEVQGYQNLDQGQIFLNEAKVNKAIANLEGVKALLESALILACR
jgi:diketogulonate reductase-like aldo/keto reductase